jgi:hypothetical protein
MTDSLTPWLQVAVLQAPTVTRFHHSIETKADREELPTMRGLTLTILPISTLLTNTQENKLVTTISLTDSISSILTWTHIITMKVPHTEGIPIELTSTLLITTMAKRDTRDPIMKAMQLPILTNSKADLLTTIPTTLMREWEATLTIRATELPPDTDSCD